MKPKRRRSVRLTDYDYSQSGSYFVTICTCNRSYLFGDIVDGAMVLNRGGQAVEQCWRGIADHFSGVDAPVFVVMPNHVHGILTILPRNDEKSAKNAANRPLGRHGTSNTIGSIVRGFKSGVTKWFRGNTDIRQVWQRNYHEHVIRDEDSYLRIAEYIDANPMRWHEDIYYTPQLCDPQPTSNLHNVTIARSREARITNI